VTSLPGPYGIGDLGPAAFAWVDTLAQARQSWWQILPLGPTGYGDSPYQCFSAFAGNPNLISPELLIQDGLLEQADLPNVGFPAGQVDYDRVGALKERITRLAWTRFEAGTARSLRAPFEQFCVRKAGWLEDYALFMALKEVHGRVSWRHWPDEQRFRHPEALEQARRELRDLIELQRFQQFLFFRQWLALKEHAHRQGVGLIGDTPIFVASDSAEVWAHPELFLLDEQRRPKVVAGVPPDYFSSTGQRWGNPLYNWPAHQQNGYAEWIIRMKSALELVDRMRLDHFRGFEAYWAIPAGNPTAEGGEWVKGPGEPFFEALHKALGRLPLIAEDLGVITPEVEALRTRFGLPGMRILQFAFGGAQENRFLPHNYERNTVVYTGTHDNDTTHGWYRTLTENERQFLRRYSPSTDGDVAWDLIRLAWASVADLALAPLQDILSLGPEARMNLPGTTGGNWRWRVTSEQLSGAHMDKLADLTEVYQR
jgi:4-alpha-glucanotransferase